MERRSESKNARSKAGLRGLAFVLLAAASAVFVASVSKGLFRRVYVYTDRSILRERASSTHPRSVLWSVPRELKPAAPQAAEPRGARSGAEEPSVGTIVYAEENGERGFDIFCCELGPQGWSEPVPIEGVEREIGGRDSEARVNSRYQELHPTLSPDGRILIFASDRPGGFGGFDLYWSRRRPGSPFEWEEPRNLGARVNSPYDDLSPALAPSGDVLVFSTDRPRSFLAAPPAEWTDVILERWSRSDLELVYAALVDAEKWRWSEPRPLPEASSRHGETDPCFSPAGDFLYFASDRPGGFGGYDLYRASVEFAQGAEGRTVRLHSVEDLGKPVNSAYDETLPIAFLDGHGLAYTLSDRSSGSRLFLETRSQEVRSTLELGSVPLAAALRYLRRLAGPIASIALLGLLALLALRYGKAWRPSLVTRCALLAVFAHGLLLCAFYFWVITGEIATSAKQETLVEVSVERLLETKVSLAALRIDVDVSAARSQVTGAEEVGARRLAPWSQEVPTPTPSNPVPPSASPRSFEPLREERVEPAEAMAADLAAPPMLPERIEHSELPVPSPQPPAEDRELSRDPPPVGSRAVAMAQGSEVPEPIADAYEPLSPERASEGAPRPAATQVQAPGELEPILPPAARPSDPPRLAGKLPIPAQAPVSESTASEISAVPAAAKLDSAAETWEDTPRSLPAQPAEAFGPSVASSGVPATLPEATEVPEGRLPYTTLPARGKSPRLPEAVAVAETPSEETDPLQRIRPGLGERTTGVLPRIAAAIESPVAALEIGPLVAKTRSRDPLVATAPLRLEPAPRPGPLETPSVPRVLSARRLPDRLPESAELPREREPGDILTPRRALAGRLELEIAELGPDLAAESQALAPASAHLSLGRPEELRPPSPPSADSNSAVLARLTPTPSSLGPGPRPLPSSRLPELRTDFFDPGDPRQYRSPAARRFLTREFGGSDETEAAVTLGLRWLAAHQSRDGRWDVDGFDAACRGCGSPGFLSDCDVAITGLALLCFLGQNHHPLNSESPFRAHAQSAIDWLLGTQTAEGLIAGSDARYTMYSHGIATLALSEAYVLTGDPRLRPALEKAAKIIVSSQNRSTGGWRYQPEPPPRGDTSVTGWQVMAIASLRRSGVSIPESTFELARHWLDYEAAGGDWRGIYGYMTPDEHRAAMVAEGMYARMLLGSKRTDRNMDEAARYIHAETQGGRLLNNLYLVYYGNLALFNYQGWIWEEWNRRVQAYLLKSQRREGSRAGSWDPTCPWSETGGRVLATCFAVLALEVYYRYLPLYWEAEGSGNLIRGRGGEGNR